MPREYAGENMGQNSKGSVHFYLNVITKPGNLGLRPYRSMVYMVIKFYRIEGVG